jgi:hypothetical protein
MNAAVELHDSHVIAIETTDSSVIVRLDAYVHRTTGRPGVNAGTGWSQTVDLIFKDGIVDENTLELPCWLSDGNLSPVADSAGMIPLPTSIPSPVRFEAFAFSGDKLVVRGNTLTAVATSEATFIEHVPE